MDPPSDCLFQQATIVSPAGKLDWLWHGYLAKGAMTLLTSRWKAGKTTLLSVLLARMATGGQLAGLPVAKAKATVVSEERLENWRSRHERLRFSDNLVLLCRPFSARPTAETWLALIEHLEGLGRQQQVEFVAIDPLAQFLPGPVENDSLAMLDALKPLERLLAANMCVLLLHHPRKKPAAAGQAARGGATLCASVDVLMEMRLPSATHPLDRRRELLAWSRYADTPRERVIELSADGRDYFESQTAPTHRAAEYLEVACRLLATPPRHLTRRQMLDAWPVGEPKPHPSLLWRTLEAAVRSGRLEQEGAGRRRDPFRYFLSGTASDTVNRR